MEQTRHISGIAIQDEHETFADRCEMATTSSEDVQSILFEIHYAHDPLYMLALAVASNRALGRELVLWILEDGEQ